MLAKKLIIQSGEEFFTVPELAKMFGITERTIRFYEAKGLLSPKRAGNVRIYTKKDKARLTVILRGKRLGFSLVEISEFLELYGTDATQVNQIQMLLGKVRYRLADLEEQRQELDTVLGELKEIENQCLDALQERGAEIQSPEISGEDTSS